jgi:hypothetical protein
MAAGIARTEFKRIVVFANSIKKHARCVAGVETDDDIGGWIRPVSGQSEGELEPRHMRVNDGKALKVFDIVDVPVTRCLNDRVHPEDWVVDATQSWKRVSQLNPRNLRAFEEFPVDLWLEPLAKTDRVAGKFLRARHGHQSLYLVRPNDLRIELSCVHNQHKNIEQKKTRAKFSYDTHGYDMGLTDPIFNDRYCTVFPALGAKPLIVRPPHGDECLICVSLTPEFNGYHYKVVASILELP